MFGPVQVPADRLVAGGRPVYFAQAYLLNRPLGSSHRPALELFLGQLTLKAGWYLDTTVRLGGVNYKVGVLDGNANAGLGDISQVQTASNPTQKTWYFRPGDCLLVNANRSGKFADDVFQSATCPFGSILYLDSKVCKVALTPGCKALRVEPWPEPLAELALQPRGDQVHDITLAWERSRGQWQLIRPAVTGGKVIDSAGQLPALRLQPVGQRPAGRSCDGFRHATQPATARERRARESQHLGLRRSLGNQGHCCEGSGPNPGAVLLELR